jgi:predicted esterase
MGIWGTGLLGMSGLGCSRAAPRGSDEPTEPTGEITRDPLPPAVSTSLPPARPGDTQAGRATSPAPSHRPGPGRFAPAPGYHASVAVLGATRLDWPFVVVPNRFEPSSPDLPPGYRSTAQSYDLFVPPGDEAGRPHPLVLFVSPGDDPAGWRVFEETCREFGVVFAGPRNTANNRPFAVRARVVLDVLDDVRRRLAIDPDRVYLAGLSGGGRVAARVAFALPEACAGVLPICGAYSLREEPWVRLRTSERLSVALLSGEKDWLRPETEREYLPVLDAYRVRARLVCYPGGHVTPPPRVVRDAFLWLEDGLEARRALARRCPASRAEPAPTPGEWSEALVEEGLERLRSPESTPYGLLQLHGVASRWKGLPAAARAEKALEPYDGRGRPSWKDVLHNERLRFALLQSRAFDAHMLGPQAPGFPAPRGPLWAMLETSWREALELAKGTPYEREARDRLAALAKR